MEIAEVRAFPGMPYSQRNGASVPIDQRFMAYGRRTGAPGVAGVDANRAQLRQATSCMCCLVCRRLESAASACAMVNSCQGLGHCVAGQRHRAVQACSELSVSGRTGVWSGRAYQRAPSGANETWQAPHANLWLKHRQSPVRSRQPGPDRCPGSGCVRLPAGQFARGRSGRISAGHESNSRWSVSNCSSLRFLISQANMMGGRYATLPHLSRAQESEKRGK